MEWRGRDPSHAIPWAKVEERAVGRHARARRAVTVVAKSWSRLTRGGLAEFALLHSAQFLAGPVAAVGGETIEMPRRTALRNRVFPACFKPSPLVQAHEDGIESARRNIGLKGHGIAMMPLGGVGQEGIEDGQGRMREADAYAHALTLHR